MDISQREAEETMRAAARLEGIFAGVSSGGALSAALRLSAEVDNALIVVIICDRGERGGPLVHRWRHPEEAPAPLRAGDRYLSTGCFGPGAAARDPRPCPWGEFPSAASRMSAYSGPHYVVSGGCSSSSSWPDRCC